MRELAAGESTEVAGVEVLAVDAVHDRHRLRYGRGGATRSATSPAGAVYFAGDTDLFDGMADIAGLEVALIPVWGWGPTLGEGHLDPEAAARAAALLRPRIAVPIHWGTFFPQLMHLWKPDRLTDPPHEFAAAVASLAPDGGGAGAAAGRVHPLRRLASLSLSAPERTPSWPVCPSCS